MSTKNTQGKDRSFANEIIDLIINECELVHNDLKEPFAVVLQAGNRHVYNIRSKSFTDWISSKYYASKKAALSDATLKTIIGTLSGKAVFGGRQVAIHTRIAKTKEGYWIDLCNDNWEAVLINSEGWKVLSGDSVPLFCRSNSMLAIPKPIVGGSIEILWKLVNVPSADQMMVLTWLLECLREDTPHVVLELVGEQGSAKSTTQKFLRMLIDPNVANLRAAPKKVEDVWIGALNSHLVSLENISNLGHEYQDALCVLATGGAHATRTFYTNNEEVIINLRKPIVINGISSNVTSQDLLDRAIHIELPTVDNRLQSSVVDQDFETHYSSMFGAMLDQFVAALRLIDAIEIPHSDRPRMIDFAILGEAVSRANSFPAGMFIDHYKLMRSNGVHRTIDSSPVGSALLSFLQSHTTGWSGQLNVLLSALNPHKPNGEHNWPKSAKALGDNLRRLSPALRTLGFECKPKPRQAGSIIWEITPQSFKLPKQSTGSTASPEIDHDLTLSGGHSVLAGHEFHSFEETAKREVFPIGFTVDGLCEE
jgi:hypothetical protein